MCQSQVGRPSVVDDRSLAAQLVVGRLGAWVDE